MLKWVSKIIGGDSSEREVKKLESTIQEVNSLEPEFKELSDEELRDKTTEFQG